MTLREIKGIGPKTEELMNRLQIYTAEDLLKYYPLGYDLYPSPTPVALISPGGKAAVRARVISDVVLRHFKKMAILTCEVSDGEGTLRLTWYNAPFLAHVLTKGKTYVFRGVVREKGGRTVMDHPEILTPEKYADLEGSLVPVYGLTKGLSSGTIAKAVRQVIETDASECADYLPDWLREELRLDDLKTSLREIHFPESAESLRKARERLVFDEFFLFILGIRILKAREEGAKSAYPMRPVWECEEVIGRLPYRLTSAQLNAWREIEAHMSGTGVMSRLLQGDVGSGKTVISFLAMIMAAANGYQSALMAPTEVLASQHYEKLMKMKEDAGIPFIKPVLLTGSTKAADQRRILAEISSGEANAVIGTHAVFQDRVAYRNLALVITDEQHRFGVRQRQSLTKKGGCPHTLVMSATPIPRTLGVIYYGDLDISVIDELPSRRLPVKSAVVDTSYMEKAMRFLSKEMAEGRQAYVICPMIEPSEELELANVREETARLKKEFRDYSVGMLHGGMPADRKNKVMEMFARGEIDLLVSTTVVEVGVDVPNAAVMLIENAERFGLAQLHQLRGRVGRGTEQSYCIFMAGDTSGGTMERLNILKESSDGFVIAEKDFALRGPGDLLGIRQSGDARFLLADVTRDSGSLKKAGETAARILREDPSMETAEYAKVREHLTAYLTKNNSDIAL